MNAKGRLQSFQRAFHPVDFAKSEAQIALDLVGDRTGRAPGVYDDAATRAEMARKAGLADMASAIFHPEAEAAVEPDMVFVEL